MCEQRCPWCLSPSSFASRCLGAAASLGSLCLALIHRRFTRSFKCTLGSPGYEDMHNPCWFDLFSDIFFNQHFRDMISSGIKRRLPLHRELRQSKSGCAWKLDHHASLVLALRDHLEGLVRVAKLVVVCVTDVVLAIGSCFRVRLGLLSTCR